MITLNEKYKRYGYVIEEEQTRLQCLLELPTDEEVDEDDDEHKNESPTVFEIKLEDSESEQDLSDGQIDSLGRRLSDEQLRIRAKNSNIQKEISTRINQILEVEEAQVILDRPNKRGSCTNEGLQDTIVKSAKIIYV
ncbi:hypothetical protein ILUMI_23541 [Ignelater luminosus]|uniref:Uncharacterized protein n=1 Tax=Ignelater luminosus TaxID=2038154 RepID=A0A8K0FZK0_IGNLU|nr:hypothetical protein ILUMI_23541 [Ignelater luminosus]